METKIATETKRPGRPRDESARKRILAAALELMEEVGFRHATVDAIADRAAVGKATVYRWWPNKAAILIEALREAVAPHLSFPQTGNLKDDLRKQMTQFVRMLSGRRGRMLAAFIAAAQSDSDVAEALWNYWGKPRRGAAIEAFRIKQQQKQLPEDVDVEFLLDALYGPLYYRLLWNLPLSVAYAIKIVDFVMAGLETEGRIEQNPELFSHQFPPHFFVP